MIVFLNGKTVQKRQTTEKEHIISANNLGTFYQFVNKRTANRHRPNIGVIYDQCKKPLRFIT